MERDSNWMGIGHPTSLGFFTDWWMKEVLVTRYDARVCGFLSFASLPSVVAMPFIFSLSLEHMALISGTEPLATSANNCSQGTWFPFGAKNNCVILFELNCLKYRRHIASQGTWFSFGIHSISSIIKGRKDTRRLNILKVREPQQQGPLRKTPIAYSKEL